MAHPVTCVYCKEKFDRDKLPFVQVSARRYAHKKCFEEHDPTDEDYIDKIYELLNEYKIKYDFQACKRQRGHFVTALGYTNEGICNALKYHYGVKHGNPLNADGRIGIVPYVYDEAQAYYRDLEKKQKRIAREIGAQMKQKPEIIVVGGKKKRKRPELIDLDSIGGEDEI